jgi:hypothetical protein
MHVIHTLYSTVQYVRSYPPIAFDAFRFAPYYCSACFIIARTRTHLIITSKHASLFPIIIISEKEQKNTPLKYIILYCSIRNVYCTIRAFGIRTVRETLGISRCRHIRYEGRVIIGEKDRAIIGAMRSACENADGDNHSGYSRLRDGRLLARSMQGIRHIYIHGTNNRMIMVLQ